MRYNGQGSTTENSVPTVDVRQELVSLLAPKFINNLLANNNCRMSIAS